MCFQTSVAQHRTHCLHHEALCWGVSPTTRIASQNCVQDSPSDPWTNAEIVPDVFSNSPRLLHSKRAELELLSLCLRAC